MARTVMLTGIVIIGLRGSSLFKVILPVVVRAEVDGVVPTVKFKALIAFGTVVPELRFSITKLARLLDKLAFHFKVAPPLLVILMVSITLLPGSTPTSIEAGSVSKRGPAVARAVIGISSAGSD